MAKRGRPRKNGAKPGWTFHRSMWAIAGYNQSRAAGEKHETALKAAVEFVKQICPEMPISVTEVKRSLAEFQPTDACVSYTISELPAEEVQRAAAIYSQLGMPGNIRRGWSFGFSERPKFERINARAKPEKLTTK